MNMSIKWFAVIAALNLMIGMKAFAQDVQIGVDSGIGLEVDIEAPELPLLDRPERPEKPERPERPDRGGVSQEVKELVAEFRSKVAEFHTEQKELIKKLKSASVEERADIRDQIKTNREGLKQVKEGFRDSVKELAGSLKEHAVKISAEARVEARGGRSRD